MVPLSRVAVVVAGTPLAEVEAILLAGGENGPGLLPVLDETNGQPVRGHFSGKGGGIHLPQLGSLVFAPFSTLCVSYHQVGILARTDLLRQHSYYKSLHYHNKVRVCGVQNLIR
jgi:hypothetical protein